MNTRMLDFKSIDVGATFSVLGKEGIFIKVEYRQAYDFLKYEFVPVMSNDICCLVDIDVQLNKDESRLEDLEDGEIFKNADKLYIKISQSLIEDDNISCYAVEDNKLVVLSRHIVCERLPFQSYSVNLKMEK